MEPSSAASSVQIMRILHRSMESGRTRKLWGRKAHTLYIKTESKGESSHLQHWPWQRITMAVIIPIMHTYMIQDAPPGSWPARWESLFCPAVAVSVTGSWSGLTGNPSCLTGNHLCWSCPPLEERVWKMVREPSPISTRKETQIIFNLL